MCALIGCTKDNISRWEHNPCGTHATSRRAKLETVRKAAAVFNLTEQEREDFANKAGLSFLGSLHADNVQGGDFNTSDGCERVDGDCDAANDCNADIARKNAFALLMDSYTGKLCELQECALVSERMFQYYMAGREPTKQALLAVSIVLGLTYKEIQQLLNTYGYCLSNSLPSDAIVMWFLGRGNGSRHGDRSEDAGHRNGSHGGSGGHGDGNVNSGARMLYEINEVLYELDLPLLMTKEYERG